MLDGCVAKGGGVFGGKVQITRTYLSSLIVTPEGRRLRWQEKKQMTNDRAKHVLDLRPNVTPPTEDVSIK